MQLTLNDLCGYSYEYLHPGYCGPIYVNQIWSEDVSAGAFCDKYWNNGRLAFRPKRVIKAEIECESPEVLNSILGKIANIVACPFDDPIKTTIDKAQEELTSAINNKIVETLNNDCYISLYDNGEVKYIVNEKRAEKENSKRYKLKHKVLKTN